MNDLINWLLNPPSDSPRATLLIRLMAGSVFLWEGVMKFVFPNQGVGRFTKLGFPAPHFTATADGWFEIIGGVLLLTGLMTRLIAVPFIIEMIVAMPSTKIPMYLGTRRCHFHLCHRKSASGQCCTRYVPNSHNSSAVLSC